jgi:hypothetical protein
MRCGLNALPRSDCLRHVHLVHVEIRVDERAVDVLPFAGSLAMQQRKADAHRCGHARRVVGDRDRELRWSAVGFADGGGEAGIGRGDIVEAGLVAERARLPGERDRAHDQPRIDPRQRVVTQAGARHHAGSEVFDEDVGLGDERMNERAPALLLDIDGDGFLRVVMLKVVRALRRLL